jgi:hypothetical protein
VYGDVPPFTVEEKEIDWFTSMMLELGTIVALKELEAKTVKVAFPEYVTHPTLSVTLTRIV